MNETAELISKLLEEIMMDLAAVKNADMALHLAVAILQVHAKKTFPPQFYVVTVPAALLDILSLRRPRVRLIQSRQDA